MKVGNLNFQCGHYSARIRFMWPQSIYLWNLNQICVPTKFEEDLVIRDIGRKPQFLDFFCHFNRNWAKIAQMHIRKLTKET